MNNNLATDARVAHRDAIFNINREMNEVSAVHAANEEILVQLVNHLDGNIGFHDSLFWRALARINDACHCVCRQLWIFSKILHQIDRESGKWVADTISQLAYRRFQEQSSAVSWLPGSLHGDRVVKETGVTPCGFEQFALMGKEMEAKLSHSPIKSRFLETP
ncbi:MAG: hypothetical protein K9N10_19000 [Deltaproteobacteria bacterium]|nr:hypothetical protein [Deltaproteobacteria bacterium]